MSVILETTLGDIVIDLFTDERPRGKIRLENIIQMLRLKKEVLIHFKEWASLSSHGGD